MPKDKHDAISGDTNTKNTKNSSTEIRLSRNI